MDEFEEMHDYQGAALAFLQTFSPQDLAPAAPAEPLFMPSETDAPPPSKPKYTEDQLRLMPEWIETSKRMFEVMNEGQRFIGSDKQAASYGLDLMSEFNWNMAGPAGIPGESGISVPGFGVQVYNLMSESAGPDAANGFLNMLDIYADTKTEGATIKRAFRGLAADPLTYATPVGSLYSLGAKAMARKTATTGLRNMLMSTAKASGYVGEKAMAAPGKTGMAAGAGYGMGFEGGLMGVETAAGDQPTLAEAATRLAVSGTVGSAVGGTLGKAFVGGGKRKMVPDEPDVSYRMEHQPRGPEDDLPVRLDDLTKSTTGEQAGYPDDFYTKQGQQIYAPAARFADDEFGIANTESYNAIAKVKGNPDETVTIYRGVPNDPKIKKINRGDFVTLSPKYAELHAASGYGRDGDQPGKVISMKVKVKDIYWDGNDVNEFGYFPNSEAK